MPKRGAPVALLLVLGGIVLTTLATCGVGGWLVADSIRSVDAARQEGRGPLEVRDETHHVVMEREPFESDVELFTRAAAHQTFDDALLRRIDGECDAELRARTVGAEADVGPWLDLFANGEPSGPETTVSIVGIGSGIQHTYRDNGAGPFTLIGFIQGDTLLTLDIAGDPSLCAPRVLNSIHVDDGPLAQSIHAPLDISAPTFVVEEGHFDGFTSGLQVEIPEAFRIADRNSEFHWAEDDEVILLHDNGTEIHIAVSATAFPEEDIRCAPIRATDEGQLRRTFDGEERLFLGSWLPPRQVYETEYCVGRMVVYIIARGPSETRTAQALSALSGRVTVQEPNLRDMPGHHRRGGENWSYRDDVYIHVPSGMAWHRPAFVEVRTNGVALPRDGYPERAVQFDFLRRDLNIRGSVWAHGTSMSAAEYHTAFVTASFGQAPETIEPAHIGACAGSRSTTVADSVRIIATTCVQNGQAIAVESVGPFLGEPDAANIAQATDAILAAFATEVPHQSPGFRVAGAEVIEESPTLASASVEPRPLSLDVTRFTAWSGTVAHAQASYFATQRLTEQPRFRSLERTRIFAATTDLRATVVSGFPAQERRLSIAGRALRFYSVLIDGTAYVITLHGTPTTPEAEWSRALATVHIDP